MLSTGTLGRRLVLYCVAAALLAGCSGSAPSPQERNDPTPSQDLSLFSFQKEEDRIHVLVDGRPFTTFHFEKKWDKPFLHPIRSLAGTEVSRGWPVQPRPGESDDHIWHRGLFMGHDRINGIDFWREKGRDQTGTLPPRLAPVGSIGDGTAEITAQLDLRTPSGTSLGALQQGFTFSKVEENMVIDVDITVRADRGTPLTMGDTEEGWVGLRFDDAFKQENGATLLNSSGLVGTENIWGQRAEWVDYSTTLKGEVTGVAFFDHPSNPGHPTYWHARGYGLCTANPFGVRDFTGDASRDGTMTIPEGGRLRFRYRLVIHPGNARDAQIDRLYREYKSRSGPR